MMVERNEMLNSVCDSTTMSHELSKLQELESFDTLVYSDSMNSNNSTVQNDDLLPPVDANYGEPFNNNDKNQISFELGNRENSLHRNQAAIVEDPIGLIEMNGAAGLNELVEHGNQAAIVEDPIGSIDMIGVAGLNASTTNDISLEELKFVLNDGDEFPQPKQDKKEDTLSGTMRFLLRV